MDSEEPKIENPGQPDPTARLEPVEGPGEPPEIPPAAEDAIDIFAGNIGQTACHRCGNVVDCSSARPFTSVECPRCHAKFSAPGKLGDFVLLRILGRGAMGVTYKAYDRKLGRYVAVKAMRQKMCQDTKRVSAFLAEARSQASLNHPNVAQVYSLGEEKGQHYIVMELLPGGQLDRLFGRESPLEESRALDLLIDVAEGLKAANAIGLIHGDVKPANILLDDHGLAKLVDFGIARLGGGQVGADDALGTPYYVAPEQILRQSVDFRTDIFSLGATMYYALTGRQAFNGKTVKEVLRARLNAPTPDPRSVRPDLHAETAELVMKMMSRTPAGRHVSYDDLLGDMWKTYQAVMQQAIDKHQAVGTGIDLSVPSLTPAQPRQVRRPARPAAGVARKRDFTMLVIALLALITVIAMVLVLIWWTKTSA